MKIYKIRDFLPKIKANRFTYYNLDKKTREQFQKAYKFLKRKNLDKKLFPYQADYVFRIILMRKDLDYCKKYDAIKYLSQI